MMEINHPTIAISHQIFLMFLRGPQLRQEQPAMIRFAHPERERRLELSSQIGEH
jgi:hypothetical protein